MAMSLSLPLKFSKVSDEDNQSTIAPSSHCGDSTIASTTFGPTFSVKNTFVDLLDDEETDLDCKRRASSAPPTCRRRADDFGFAIDADDVDDVDDAQSELEWITATTDSGDSDTEVTGSETNWSATTLPHDAKNNGTATPETATPETITPRDKEEVPKEEVPIVRTSLRTLLSTKARAFAPSEHIGVCGATTGFMPMGVPMVDYACQGSASPSKMGYHGMKKPPQWAKKELAEVVAAIKGTLVMYGPASVCPDGEAGGKPKPTEVEVKETEDGWSVRARCGSQEALRQAGSVLSLAQEAMIQAAETSKGVFVIGYEVGPFAPARFGCGFSATLAVVSDEDSVCWDLLRCGHCSRGRLCRWRHPEWQPVVEVVAELAEGVTGAGF